MATFRAAVATPRAPRAAFDFMADASNFERWDPGVISSRQVAGDGAENGAEFDVEVRAIGGPLVLRYRTTRFAPPTPNGAGRVQLEAVHPRLKSIDSIEVRPHGEGSLVTYTADLRLTGWWGVFAPLMALGFHRIGERAVEGLVGALGGTRISV